MRTVVFDSSALLAHFLGEKGGSEVKRLLVEARRRRTRIYMSAVNLAEVTYTVARRRGLQTVKVLLEWLCQLPIAIVAADQGLAIAAGLLKNEQGIPYGDCFATALAHRLGAEVVTRDPDFEKVQDIVKVTWIGPPPEGSR